LNPRDILCSFLCTADCPCRLPLLRRPSYSDAALHGSECTSPPNRRSSFPCAANNGAPAAHAAVDPATAVAQEMAAHPAPRADDSAREIQVLRGLARSIVADPS